MTLRYDHWATNCSPVQRDGVLDGAIEGHYNLLLGAGASVDSRSSSGSDIPLARQLAEEMSEHFSLPNDDDLVHVYDRAESTAGPDEVYSYLHRRFTGCTPAGWYAQLVSVPWKRLWTLNVDDVLENAYERYGSTAARLTRINWHENYREENALQAIHLHGSVHDATPIPLVFSLLEYISARDRSRSWHTIFGDEWEDSPFIVVGAGLIDELDLGEVFRSRQPRSARPSLYVSPTISEKMRFDLARWNLVPIELPAAEFFDQLYTDLSPARQKVLQPWLREGRDRAAAIFLHQFRNLSRGEPGAAEPGHDLYKGDQPLWTDICASLDARQTWISAFAERGLRLAKGDIAQAVAIASGPRCTGKTVGLLRVARRLETAGYFPMLFRGEDGLNVDAITRTLGQSAGLVLLFDGIADISVEVSELLRRCHADETRCIILATERETRLGQISDRWSTTWLDPDDVIEIVPLERRAGAFRPRRSRTRLRHEDARSLAEHLGARGRLGTLAQSSVGYQISVFEKHGLFDGMYIATLGAGFRQRIDRMVEEISSPAVRRALVLVSVIDNLGYSTPASLLRTCTSDGSSPDVRVEEFSQFIATRGSSLYSRHRTLTLNSSIDSYPKEELADFIAEVLRHLSPHVTQSTLEQGALLAMIARGLMRARTLVHWVGANHLEPLYGQIEESYSWNGPFWEQRAIGNELAKDWERAASFGAHACTVSRDDYRHTTYATILINWALETAAPQSPTFVEKINLADQQFATAHTYRTTNPVPVVTYLQLLIRIAQAYRAAHLTPPPEVVTRWNRFHEHGQVISGRRRNATLTEELAQLQTEWMRQIVG